MGEINRENTEINRLDFDPLSDDDYGKWLTEIIFANKSAKCTKFFFHYKKDLDKLPFKDFVCTMNDCSNLSHYPNFNKYFALKGVPSLLQISRDVIRRILFNKQVKEDDFKSHEGINRLNLLNKLKDILVLKREIY